MHCHYPAKIGQITQKKIAMELERSLGLSPELLVQIQVEDRSREFTHFHHVKSPWNRRRSVQLSIVYVFPDKAVR